MEPLRKRRLLDAQEQERLKKRRAQNDARLKSTFESIFDKYGKDFTGVGDVIDLETGELVINNGHLMTMEHEQDVQGRANDEDELGAGFSIAKDRISAGAGTGQPPSCQKCKLFASEQIELSQADILEGLTIEPAWQVPELLPQKSDAQDAPAKTFALYSDPLRSPSPDSSSLWALQTALTSERNKAFSNFTSKKPVSPILNSFIIKVPPATSVPCLEITSSSHTKQFTVVSTKNTLQNTTQDPVQESSSNQIPTKSSNEHKQTARLNTKSVIIISRSAEALSDDELQVAPVSTLDLETQRSPSQDKSLLLKTTLTSERNTGILNFPSKDPVSPILPSFEIKIPFATSASRPRNTSSSHTKQFTAVSTKHALQDTTPDAVQESSSNQLLTQARNKHTQTARLNIKSLKKISKSAEALSDDDLQVAPVSTLDIRPVLEKWMLFNSTTFTVTNQVIHLPPPEIFHDLQLTGPLRDNGSITSGTNDAYRLPAHIPNSPPRERSYSSGSRKSELSFAQRIDNTNTTKVSLEFQRFVASKAPSRLADAGGIRRQETGIRPNLQGWLNRKNLAGIPSTGREEDPPADNKYEQLGGSGRLSRV